MSKFFTYIQGCVALTIGTALCQFYFLSDNRPLLLIIPGTIVSVIGYTLLINALKERYRNLKTQRTYALRSFQWYIDSNPECFQNNQLLCSKCGSKAIVYNLDYAASLPQLFGGKTAMVYNRHTCKQCASTLFYTPLDNE